MAAYAKALRRSAEVPFLGRHGFRFLVRFFIEAHIRAQLKRVADAYILLEQVLGPSDSRLPWIRDTRAQLERSVGMLRNISRIVTALSPAAILPVAGLLKGVDFGETASRAGLGEFLKPEDFTFISTFALVGSFYAFVYFLAVALLSFCAKRLILFPGSRSDVLLPMLGSYVAGGGTNVYQLEERLFRLLPLRKGFELRADLVIGFVYGLTLVLLGLWILMALRSDLDWAILLVIVPMLGVGLAAVVVVVIRWRRRRWR